MSYQWKKKHGEGAGNKKCDVYINVWDKMSWLQDRVIVECLSAASRSSNAQDGARDAKELICLFAY